ncbi:MAG: DVU0150 family protein [Pseudomonadota bacterium]
MFRNWITRGGLLAVLILLPSLAWAAGGGGASEIVVVADTRQLTGWNFYFAELYNENMWMFATWAVVLTTACGAVLGVVMDFVMKRTGIDLTSREIVEH